MALIPLLQLLKDAPVQLKAIKIMPGRSGYAWTANVYKDGKKVGDVLDEANGGMIRVNLPEELLNTLNDIGHERNGCQHEPAGYYLSELADAEDVRRKLKRKAKDHLLFIPATEKGGDSYRLYKASDVAESREMVVKAYGADVTFLNDLV